MARVLHYIKVVRPPMRDANTTGLFSRMVGRHGSKVYCKSKGCDSFMKRYCIICHSMFGCIKDGVKYSCKSCPSSRSCLFLYDYSARNVTSGICETCWENHGTQRFKEAVHAS